MAGNGREPLKEPLYVPGIFRRSPGIFQNSSKKNMILLKEQKDALRRDEIG